MQAEGPAKGAGASGRPTVLRSAAFMSLGTLFSRIFGMLRDMVLAAEFSLMVKDAYVVAFRLPNLFRRLFGEGSLAASFIPVFVEQLNAAGVPEEAARERAREFANAVYTLLLIVTMVITVLGIAFMPWIIDHWVSGEGYQSIAGKVELTIKLARWMFAFVFLVTLYAYLMSILNVYKKFFIPALAPAVFNLIFIIFCFVPQFEFMGDQLAAGVLVGGVAQLLMVVVPLVRMGEMPRLSFGLMAALGSTPVRVFFRNLLPSLAGMSILQLMAIMNTFFASHLPQGAHSYFYFADRLLEFPQSLISVSMGVALLPTLSELWARGDREGMVNVTRRHARLLLFLSLPAAVGLLVLGRSVVEAIYMRQEFDANDAVYTAEILQIYALMLIFTGVHRVMVPAFYAIKNTWLPAVISLCGLVVHYFVAGYCVRHFGLGGLAGATAFSAFMNMFLLGLAFRRWFGPVGVGSLLMSAGWLVPGLAAMAGVAYVIDTQVRAFGFGSVAAVAVAIPLAACVYFIVNHILRHPDNNEVLGLLRRRLRR